MTPAHRSSRPSGWWCSPAGASCWSPGGGSGRWWPWLCVVAALGILAAACGAWLSAPASLTEALEGYGAVDVSAGRTAWSWVGVVAGLLAVGAAAVATVDVRGWPEMGSRYDAPGAQPEPVAATEPEESTNLDLWRAIDDGQDPTATRPVTRPVTRLTRRSEPGRPAL